MERLEQIGATYDWYQAYGNKVETRDGATYVTNTEHPAVWVANHVSGVRAGDRDAIERVLAHAERAFAHCEHRMVFVDSLTPEAFIARLVLDDYAELKPILQQVLEGPLPARAATASLPLRPVASEQDWESVLTLVRANHLEGKTGDGISFGDHVTRGIVAGYRSKAAICQFFIAQIDGKDCGYGSVIVGPHGMGIVEDLFTLPQFRGRGVATAIIAQAVRTGRARGMGPMLIGALADETPKHMYAALGFEPRALTRRYLLQAGTNDG